MRFVISFNKVVAMTVLLGAVMAGTSHAFPVEDALTEANTGHTSFKLTTVIDRLWAIQGYDYNIYASLTVGGGSGFYVPARADLINWNNTIFSAINDQNFAYEFPGWQARQEGENAAATEQTLVTATLNTYKDAMTVAHDQADELAGENFGSLEGRNTQTTRQLDATQLTNELLLQVIKQLQYSRQLTIADIMVHATAAAQTLNDQARAGADALAHGW